MFDHTIQTYIYEKVLKKHYLGIISIDFEHQGKIEVLYEDKDAFNRDAIFPLTDQRTFDEYVQNTLMKYVAGYKEDICRIQAQLKKRIDSTRNVTKCDSSCDDQFHAGWANALYAV